MKARVSKKIDSRTRRNLREVKRNPVAENLNKFNKPATHKPKKSRFKDLARDNLEDWDGDFDIDDEPES